MAVVDGKERKTNNVPFPKYDYPGSKISPFTGKPYTKAEAARVYSKTRVKNARNLSMQNAIDRRLEKAHPAQRKGPLKPPAVHKPIKNFLNKLPIGLKDWKEVDLPVGMTSSAKAAKERSELKRRLEALEKSRPKKSTSIRGGFRE